MLTAPNLAWSMDFVADALFVGRRFRALTIVDNFTKESLAIEVNQQLKGEDFVAVMERLRHQRDLPQRIQTGNGSEFILMAMDRWAYATTTAWSWITTEGRIFQFCSDLILGGGQCKDGRPFPYPSFPETFLGSVRRAPSDHP